jgi:hypothetical protein
MPDFYWLSWGFANVCPGWPWTASWVTRITGKGHHAQLLFLHIWLLRQIPAPLLALRIQPVVPQDLLGDWLQDPHGYHNPRMLVLFAHGPCTPSAVINSSYKVNAMQIVFVLYCLGNNEKKSVHAQCRHFFFLVFPVLLWLNGKTQNLWRVWAGCHDIHADY